MENREQFLHGLLNPFEQILLIQIFQESEIVFKETVTINTTREGLEAASNKLNGKILLGQPIVMTFKEFLRFSRRQIIVDAPTSLESVKTVLGRINLGPLGGRQSQYSS